MVTKLQLGIIHMAVKQLRMSDGQYRILLKNVAGVSSALALSQAGFEDCMSVLEDSGFRDSTKAPDYWRDRVATRGAFCNARMSQLIVSLAGTQRYALPGLCQRVSGGRADRMDKLRPQEGWNLIEALKAINARGAAAARETQGPGSPAEATAAAGMPSESSLGAAGQPGGGSVPAAAVAAEATPTLAATVAKSDPWPETWFPSHRRGRRW